MVFLTAFFGGFFGAFSWWWVSKIKENVSHETLEDMALLKMAEKASLEPDIPWEPNKWESGPVDPKISKKISITADQNALKKDIERLKNAVDESGRL